MSKSPKVAVLMAAYNGREWIGEQIDTILEQRGVDVVLYVSVDHSSDNTYDYVASRALEDSRIVLLPQEVSFGCAARNFYRLICEINIQCFDFIALSDQDDRWMEEKLKRACSVLFSSDAVAYSCAVTAFWPDGREKILQKAQSQREYDFLFEAAGPGCTYVFQKDFALSLQSFLRTQMDNIQSILAHDWLFYAFCRSQGNNWIIDSRTFVQYRQHERNELGANAGYKAILRRMSLLRCGWYRSQIMQIAAVCGMNESPVLKPIAAETWLGRLAILRHIHKLRRRLRDRCVLALLCILRLL